MYEWTPFSPKVILEANRRLSQRKQGTSFALPAELTGIFNFRPKTTEELGEAFRAASRKLRQGTQA
jgi:GGDEF domain-containing protein